MAITQDGPPLQGLDLARRAREALQAKKGEQVLLLDVQKISSVNDYTLIVSGSSAPQLKGLVTEVLKTLREARTQCYRKSGSPDDGWVVLDYVDVVIHIFLAELRAYYDLEALWAEAHRVP